MKTVTVYTDGACSGNPGPGGWCAILEYQGHEKMISGGEPSTTNNRMELTAVIEALLALRGLNVKAFDLCELSPHYDHSGASTALACKTLREMLLAYCG